MDRYDIGDIEITKVVEDVAPTSPKFIFADVSYEDLQRHRDWMHPHFLDDSGKLVMSIHSFVVKTRHHTILVDTCLGNDKQGRMFPPWNDRNSPFLDDLTKAGCDPDSVDFVFCTHLHVDHVGWNTKLENGRWVPTFPNAKYLFNKEEYEYWKTVQEPHDKVVFEDSVLPIVEANRAEFVSSDYQIDDGIVLESTPGHTPGHCSVTIKSNGKDGVITGDMIHHPVQIAENHYASNFDVDQEMSTATRRTFCEKYSDRDVRIIGTHFAPPTAGRIVHTLGQWRLEI